MHIRQGAEERGEGAGGCLCPRRMAHGTTQAAAFGSKRVENLVGLLVLSLSVEGSSKPLDAPCCWSSAMSKPLDCITLACGTTQSPASSCVFKEWSQTKAVPNHRPHLGHLAPFRSQLGWGDTLEGTCFCFLFVFFWGGVVVLKGNPRGSQPLWGYPYSEPHPRVLG